MPALTFSHIGITVPDLEKAVEFYTKAFGFYLIMSVAESIFLGHERVSGGLLRKSEMFEETERVLDHVGLGISPKRLISTLSVAEQQMVEIARGVSANAKVFIFDEPTAALGDEDVKKLKRLIRELQRAGKNIFYVSHRLEEIFDLCDTITVLKDGAHARQRI